MPIPLRTRFEYGTGSMFETSLSARPWNPMDETVGGVRLAASGIPASYIVRRDALLELPLRIEEPEWADLLSLVIFGQSGETLLWFPDADDLGTSYVVYLHAPAAGERWGPNRMSEYPRGQEVTLTLRGAGSIPWQPYF